MNVVEPVWLSPLAVYFDILNQQIGLILHWISAHLVKLDE